MQDARFDFAAFFIPAERLSVIPAERAAREPEPRVRNVARESGVSSFVLSL
jgi:hypothetical protein